MSRPDINKNKNPRYLACQEQKLKAYADTKIHRHTKVQGTRSPFDGDWLYWGTRLGKDPTKPERETALLKVQQGRCKLCGGLFVADDIIEAST